LWGKALFILCGVLAGGWAVGGELVPERRARELEWELILDVVPEKGGGCLERELTLDVSAGKRGRGSGTVTNIRC
jgi:hypothetical protein